MSPGIVVGVALLGGAGAVARVVVAGALAGGRRGWPWAVTAVNVSGALVLGVLDGAGVAGDALTLAGAGFLGAYTTFSGWAFEAHRLARHRGRRAAVAHLLLPLALGLAAAWLGRLLGGV